MTAHRIEPFWDMARITEELEGAEGIVAFYARAERELTPREQKRMASWGTYAHALRNRQQELSLTAELDEEGKS